MTFSAGPECPLLALSGHTELHRTYPLSGVKRTSPSALHMSAFDPKRTCCTSDIEDAAERAQTLVNKKSRAARSKSNAARPSPTGGIQGVGRPPAVMKPNTIASHSEKENW